MTRGRPSRDGIGIAAWGAETALGDATTTLERLLAGEVALAPHQPPELPGCSPLPLALARPWGETLPPRGWDLLDRLLATAPEGPWGTPDHPVVVSSSNFGVGNLLEFRKGNADPRHLALATPGACVERLAARFGWGPDVTVVSHACVSSHLAIELARRRLEARRASRALVLSFDFLSAFVVGGFHALKILNGLPPQPYADRPEGAIGLGDGAAFAVLEAGAPWRISEAHLHNEMWHPTGNRPDGDGFARLRSWLESHAGGRRLWAKGHGTGTLDSGRLEAESLAGLLPGSPLVSWKGSLGHTLGSCGLVELAIVLAGLRRGRMPGTVGSTPPFVGATVQGDAFDPTAWDGTLLLANAFGGAHAAFFVDHHA